MRKNRILIPIVLLLFAGAGFLAYQHFRETAAERERSRRPIGRAVMGGGELNGSDLNHPPQFPKNNILVRELMRQALFVAEREELGMVTRDPTIGESAADQPDSSALGLGVNALVRSLEGVQVQLFRDTASPDGPPPGFFPVAATPDRPVLFQTLIPERQRGEVDYPMLVERAEAFSRGEFKSAIGAVRSQPSSAPIPPQTSAQLQSQIDRQMAEMNFVSQFAAVRAAHAAIRRSGGATPELVAVLVRGYANLGQLTSFEWTAASKAFAARSLLYAQRMVAAASPPTQKQRQAHALRCRSYALALAGFQAAALNDLDRADALDPPTQAAAMPAWIMVIRPYCRYQTAELAELAAKPGPETSLALFLCFLTVERCNSASITNGYGQIALAQSPDCLRIIDTMVAVSGVGANHQLTLVGPAALALSITQRLTAIPDLPPGVRTAIDDAKKAQFDPVSSAAVAQALVREGRRDTAGEPSWTVLGRLIQEAQFVHVERRARFMAESWSVDASEFTNQTLPLYRDHPYKGLIDCYAARTTDAAELARLLDGAAKHVATQQPTFALTPLFYKLQAAKIPAPSHMPSFWAWQSAFKDFNANDLERHLTERSMGPQYERGEIDELRKVSPHSLIYMQKMIQDDWAACVPELDQWVRQHGDHPMLAAALGWRYTQLKQWDQAEKFLRTYLAKAPDQWTYEMLAQNFLEQGNEPAWLATLKQRLEHPDYGLDHAKTNMIIARHYMDQKKWDVARPYADAAAESYSQWGLETAAECYEGLGDTQRANAIRAAIAERYGR